jgi:HhH-GPD superfamily base excision DNA repair protein
MQKGSLRCSIKISGSEDSFLEFSRVAGCDRPLRAVHRAGVTEVTKTLFKKYKSAKGYAQAELHVFQRETRPTGFYNNKAKAIINCCRKLVMVYHNKVPDSLEALTTLPGVGGKPPIWYWVMPLPKRLSRWIPMGCVSATARDWRTPAGPTQSRRN